MQYRLESINNFLFSIETEIINLLYDYDSLNKFDKNAKKIIKYIFIQRLFDRFKENNLFFYHNGVLSESHDIFEYFPKHAMEDFINATCIKIKKVTNRLCYIKNDKMVTDVSSTIENMDGSVIDEILLLENKSPIDPKKLRDFLKKHHLDDLFTSMAKRVY